MPGAPRASVPGGPKAQNVPYWKSSIRVFTGTVDLTVLDQPTFVLALMAVGTGRVDPGTVIIGATGNVAEPCNPVAYLLA